MERKQRVIFICTHNSARSQMAEGFCAILQMTDMRFTVPAPNRHESIRWRLRP
jgi:predicted protein tyrosine phosphatase